MSETEIIILPFRLNANMSLLYCNREWIKMQSYEKPQISNLSITLNWAKWQIQLWYFRT